MAYKNLSKTFKYVNEFGQELIFEYDYGYLINKPVGIDTIQVSMSRARGINQIGETIQSKNIQPRPIVISGVFTGDFQSENKERLSSVVLPGVKGKFYADDYYLNVEVTSTPAIDPDPFGAKFRFELLAAYPYWQSENINKKVLSGLEYKFGFPISFAEPYKFAESIKTQFINVQNRGQVPIPFNVTLISKGTSQNPKIINIVNGQFIELKMETLPDEKIVINNLHDKTYVTSSKRGDISGAISMESNLYKLQVGENVLKPEALTNVDDLEMSIDYAFEKAGITV